MASENQLEQGNHDHGYRNEEQWPQLFEGMVDRMIRFESALRPYIAALPA